MRVGGRNIGIRYNIDKIDNEGKIVFKEVNILDLFDKDDVFSIIGDVTYAYCSDNKYYNFFYETTLSHSKCETHKLIEYLLSHGIDLNSIVANYDQHVAIQELF